MTLTFTSLLTFNTGTLTVSATAVPGPAGTGCLSKIFTINADHKLLRYLLLNLNAGSENDGFQAPPER